eukprot:TRINITY_DN20126_c0_g1_i2.p1 TRINITY_DN20126_c0_g1~~TRINITY_DN20126_c0_g1_i2.p1  ORF type:complete len:222 (-),score=37.93 TRINITY_DN20126_c0_g1_i2:126-791(-)
MPVAGTPDIAQLSDHLYLDNFLDSVESLPQELQRNFMLMRQLDTRTQELMAKIERNTRDVLRRRENLSEQRTDDLVKKIRDDQKECLSFSDEKINLVSQTYELVESHVRRLDSELDKFETELREKEATESSRGNKNKRQKTDKDDGKLMFSGRGWIGQKVLRFWDEEAEWFESVVTDFKPDQGGHKLTYDIGTEMESFEWYDLDHPIATEVDLSAFKVSTI